MALRNIIGALSAAVITLSCAAIAQQTTFGTAQEARAMLDKAAKAVTTDKAAALAMFNNGGGGFKDRDLYPFCFNLSDGKFVSAVKALMGRM